MNDSFDPSYIFRNPHLQTIMASFRPRRLFLGKRVRELLKAAKETILDCGEGVRLLGSYSGRPERSDNIAVLIHGWEGSIDSTYILSAAGMLYAHGCNVFRLNLRDHGNSLHLNPQLFNSTRIDEVVNGIAEVFRLFPHKKRYLAGFSLGGNFALRVGLLAPQKGVRLDRIVAVSPLISPGNTTERLENKLPVYHAYFVRKWKSSLRKKVLLFPELGYEESMLKLNTLGDLNDYFVPNHTNYTTAESYLHAYGLTGKRLEPLCIDSHILTAEDDPITTVADLALVTSKPASLHIELTRYGGHCGFLQGLLLRSWVDQRLVRLFS